MYVYLEITDTGIVTCVLLYGHKVAPEINGGFVQRGVLRCQQKIPGLNKVYALYTPPIERLSLLIVFFVLITSGLNLSCHLKRTKRNNYNWSTLTTGWPWIVEQMTSCVALFSYRYMTICCWRAISCHEVSKL